MKLGGISSVSMFFYHNFFLNNQEIFTTEFWRKKGRKSIKFYVEIGISLFPNEFEMLGNVSKKYLIDSKIYDGFSFLIFENVDTFLIGKFCVEIGIFRFF